MSVRPVILASALSLGIIILASCSAPAPQQTGVSQELALSRAETVSGVEYSLFFSVPQDDSPVMGRADISFSLSEKEDLVLDFRPGSENVLSVCVGGKKADAIIGNEHIVVPSRYLTSGSNTVSVEFISQDQSLNRNPDYLYTLLVPDRARTVFPCFDQPDIKARFFLTLEIPSSWKALANGALEEEQSLDGERKRLRFGDSGIISTYLFAFCAGRFNEYTASIGKRMVTALYRETDPLKVAQMPDIFEEAGNALAYMEEYTGIPYPYGKYGFAILPGFQFGGMEHPGAIFFTDRRMFLPEHPTTAERISRVELISHETAHMWFGDAVTMKWFNDVWIKEVFANHFAAKVSAEKFGEVDSSVNEFTSFNIPAYAEDRSRGTVSLSQPLDNLQNAGLVYGNIVYDKAPVVMRMLSSMMGEDPFRSGLREYLSRYMYSNATWDNLIDVLDKYSETDLKGWSDAWVHSEGMPRITAELNARNLVVRQEDPLGRNVVWPQEVDFALADDGKVLERITLWLDSDKVTYDLGHSYPTGTVVVPNLSSKGYGYFVLGPDDVLRLEKTYHGLSSPAERVSVLATLYENNLEGRVKPETFAGFLRDAALSESNPLVAGTAVSYLKSMAVHGPLRGSEVTEGYLYDISTRALSQECRVSAYRALIGVFHSGKVGEELYSVWEHESTWHGISLGERDYMTLSYELAVRFPEKFDTIKRAETERLSDPDRKREFEFVIRAVDPSQENRDALMESLLEKENRIQEPWVNSALGYLNHTLRQKEAVKYIRPALEELLEIQRTGDIFFPKNWISAVLSQHDTPEAKKEVQSFLSERPDYPVIMKNKILQSADLLFRETVR
ncbi:MAG: aminopeptidase [Bacteroidales bacterium]|nr:aminopeptidase [Bacteroidales bacterium]